MKPPLVWPQNSTLRGDSFATILAICAGPFMYGTGLVAPMMNIKAAMPATAIIARRCPIIRCRMIDNPMQAMIASAGMEKNAYRGAFWLAAINTPIPAITHAT